jgi:hypothetical protein
VSPPQFVELENEAPSAGDHQPRDQPSLPQPEEEKELRNHDPEREASREVPQSSFGETQFLPHCAPPLGLSINDAAPRRYSMATNDAGMENLPGSVSHPTPSGIFSGIFKPAFRDIVNQEDVVSGTGCRECFALAEFEGQLRKIIRRSCEG